MEALSNYVSDAVDRVVARLEEGAAILLGSEIPLAPTNPQPDHTTQEFSQEGEYFSQEDMNMESPLSGMAQGVLNDILSKQAGPQTVMEHIHAFSAAVTWREPFVIGLVSLQVVLLLCTIVAIRSQSLWGRMTLFLLMVALSRAAEWINTHLYSHFDQYGISQNYFDASGLFMTVLMCGPMMLYCMALLLSFVWESKNLLVEVKRMELRKKMKAQQSKSNTTRKGSNEKKTKSKKEN